MLSDYVNCQNRETLLFNHPPHIQAAIAARGQLPSVCVVDWHYLKIHLTCELLVYGIVSNSDH